jgi:hypothetical protein
VECFAKAKQISPIIDALIDDLNRHLRVDSKRDDFNL